jgi:hypothetical protein
MKHLIAVVIILSVLTWAVLQFRETKEVEVVRYVKQEVPKYIDKPFVVEKVVEKPVEKIVYVDRPVPRVVERVVYRDRIVYKDRFVYKPYHVWRIR